MAERNERRKRVSERLASAEKGRDACIKKPEAGGLRPFNQDTSGGSALRLVGLDLDDVVRGGFLLAGGAHADVAGALMEGGEI